MSEIDALRNETINLHLSLKAIIQEIQQCDYSLDDYNELNKNGRERIIEIRQGIAKMKVLCQDEIRKDVKLPLETEIKSLEEELRTTVTVFQRANVNCLAAIEKSWRKELLGPDVKALLLHRKNKDKADLVKMSSDVTDRLLSISRTLADTTQRSGETVDSLVTSSGVVDGTRGELDSQGSVIAQSSKLLSKYGRREQTDKFLILFGFAFFFACCMYIIQKRLF